MIEIEGLQKIQIDENIDRVETGPVQFIDDWPGLFIRGDNAMFYSMCIDNILREVEASIDGPLEDYISKVNLESLSEMLKGCLVK